MSAPVEIVLRHARVLLVDAEDVGLVLQHTWTPVRRRGTHYAMTNVRRPDGSRTTVSLHRLLTGAGPGVEVDHRNGNGLDDRRMNLRESTPSQNRANRPAPVNSRSGFKGVSWDKARGHWAAYITVGSRKRHLGRFEDVLDAARAYDMAALDAWGEFARLNLPPPQAARDGGAGCPGNAPPV